MTNKISFENLPLAVEKLTAMVAQLQKTIEKMQQPETDRFLDIDEASKFLHLTKGTLYIKVSRGEVPHFKRGNRLYFSLGKLTEYLEKGSVKTREEIKAEY